MVFLYRAGLGGTEKTLRRQSGVSVEDRAARQDWAANFARAGGMVLPPQRHAHALALHAEQRMVRTGLARISRAKLRSGSSQGFWNYRRSRAPRARLCWLARGKKFW